MAVGIYTYTNLKDQIVDPLIYPNIATDVTVLNVINRAARLVNADLDLRSAKRKSVLASKLFDDQYDYAKPSDLKRLGLIDIADRTYRDATAQWELRDQTDFERLKAVRTNIVAFADDELVGTLKISADVDDTVTRLAGFDSLTADGGTWALFGDAENVAADTDNFIQGSGSVKFDISSAGGTTAGLQNSSVDTFDLTDVKDNGSAFVWVYINTVVDTGSDGLTNFILRAGSDSSNYYSMTVTTTNEGAAFTAGWNLLRFDFSGKSTTGTPDDDAGAYIALYMTKETGKVDDGYRFDNLVIHTGEYFDIVYYSKYPWQSSAGAYKENSTTPTDLINADTDEFELFVTKGKVEMFRDLKQYDDMKIAQSDYMALKKEYQRQYKSERLNLINEYYTF